MPAPRWEAVRRKAVVPRDGHLLLPIGAVSGRCCLLPAANVILDTAEQAPYGD
jgi:hypothetical protein